MTVKMYLFTLVSRGSVCPEWGVSMLRNIHIMEEANEDSTKDTSLMLQAGAHKVVYIRATDGYLQKAFEEFCAKYDHGQPLVCESRGLRDVVVPGIFVMMMRLPTW